jgi:hypothetical protein
MEAELATRMKKNKTEQILVGKSEGKRPLVKRRHIY